jgi:hypothetical protein
MDIPGAAGHHRALEKFLGKDVCAVSGVTGKGLKQLRGELAAALNRFSADAQ